MKKLLTFLAALALIFAFAPVHAEENPEVCVLEYNKDGTIKNEEEYLKCLEENGQIEPQDGKWNGPSD